MVNCQRPYCTDPATAFIPLPEGSHRTRVFLCDAHAQQAKANCFYVQPIDGVESEEGFYKAIRTKHQRVRGNDQLRYVSRTAVTKQKLSRAPR